MVVRLGQNGNNEVTEIQELVGKLQKTRFFMVAAIHLDKIQVRPGLEGHAV